MQRNIGLLIAACALTGCAATGQSYREHLATQTAIAPNNARITVYRPDDTMLGSARDTRISLDDKTVSKVAHLGFNTFEATRGAHVIKADLWDTFGSCSLQVDFKPNTDYYFEVTPREEPIIAGTLLGFAGSAAESAGKVCGGGFTITARPKEVALRALGPLKSSQ